MAIRKPSSDNHLVSLSPREQNFLLAIFFSEREADKWELERRKRSEPPRSAGSWRWLAYDEGDSPLGNRLFQLFMKNDTWFINMNGPQVHNTFRALEQHGLILRECGKNGLYIRLTKEGRRVSRILENKPKERSKVIRETYQRAVQRVALREAKEEKE